jgi:hypothetical protein
MSNNKQQMAVEMMWNEIDNLFTFKDSVEAQKFCAILDKYKEMEKDKQQTALKLYTEDQVRKMLEVCIDSDLYEHILTFEDILKTQRPIELMAYYELMYIIDPCLNPLSNSSVVFSNGSMIYISSSYVISSMGI